ncbi:MAG: alpha/beta hydrolase [Pandoraea sp.]|nr:alpha/beta hydrolase [Pandoraea sp.]MDR3399557.1 alpha/beta hydrolase [Pandoraea sp.]
MESELEITDVMIDGYSQRIAVRSYRPVVAHKLPVLFCLHGGGFVEGGVNDVRDLSIRMARMLPAWVIGVEYSLAPSLPFPAALEDVYLAIRWAADNASRYRADPQRMAAVGSEAGGSIVAGVSAMARDRAAPVLRAQVLLAPLLDPSMTRVGEPTSRLVTDEMRARAAAQCYRAYLPAVSDRTHPYAAPIESKRLARLPATLIASADKDIFRADGEAYARALISAGVPVVATRYGAGDASELAENDAVLGDAMEFLRKHLTPEGQRTGDVNPR